MTRRILVASPLVFASLGFDFRRSGSLHVQSARSVFSCHRYASAPHGWNYVNAGSLKRKAESVVKCRAGRRLRGLCGRRPCIVVLGAERVGNGAVDRQLNAL
jgi:hypothetical protein